MSIEFEVTGLFYEIGEYKCRKYLDIKRICGLKKQPDLMVVMMNPGSSFPLDGIDNNSRRSMAKPDKTQNQIVKIMNEASFDYARILNLSDLRTPNSDKLYKFIKSSESKCVPHSIFDDSRKRELSQLFIKNAPVIFAWGVNSALVPLAKKAVESLSIDNPLGILKLNTDFSYYHPLPKIHEKQTEWVQYVAMQITRKQQNFTSI